MRVNFIEKILAFTVQV